MAEAHAQAYLTEFGEFGGRDITLDGDVLQRGPQVLSQCEDVAVCRAQVPHGLTRLVQLLAHAEHHAALGHGARRHRLGPRQEFQRAVKLRLRTHRGIEPGDGLEVMVQDVGSGLHHQGQRLPVALEVRDQHFNAGLGAASADGADGGGKDARAAIGELVAVNAGNDRVAQMQPDDGLRHPRRLFRVQPRGAAGLHSAEPAGASADVPQDHKGRRTALPAIPDVGAPGALADGMQAQFAHKALEVPVVGPHGRADLEPFGPARRRLRGRGGRHRQRDLAGAERHWGRA